MTQTTETVKTWLTRLEAKMSKALGCLLKVELKDLKLTTEKELI